MVEQAKWLAFTSKFWREFLSILLAGKTLTDDQMTERDKVVGGHAAADDDRCKCTIGHLVDSNREISECRQRRGGRLPTGSRDPCFRAAQRCRSEEHTSELQSLTRTAYA